MTERELLAAEHALRLLTGEELMQARVLQAEDPTFRSEVEAWSVLLAPLLDEIGSVRPGPEMWQRIEGLLDAPTPSAEVIRMRRRVRRWQAFSGLAAAIAAALALVAVPTLLKPPSAPPSTPRLQSVLIASLGDPNAPGAVAVTFVPERDELVVTASAIERAVGRDHQLWVIPTGGSPVSLGLVATDRVTRRKVPQVVARHLGEGATIALSLEPAGGSPSGQPTGPVVASGPLRTV